MIQKLDVGAEQLSSVNKTIEEVLHRRPLFSFNRPEQTKGEHTIVLS